ncbi:hypothetical protein ACH42_01255 [Endozoicomonas sp. (ex Bugula neritina AB1)]|nr:hypothetical protein ACH42_01255 [Endozoicomonas sp. (ex Bugula neritina AB1)]
MRLTFLGTSAGLPTIERNVTALALAIDDNKEWYLVDCGEATQHQLLRCRYTLHNLQAIFITHIHGDHMYGLPGLLTSASMQGRTAPLTIYAPEGVEPFVKAALNCGDVHGLPYDLYFIRTDLPDFQYQDNNVSVTSHELSHRVPSFAYRFVENTVSTQLNQAELKRLGVPKGALWGKLQNNETITLDNGLRVRPEQAKIPPPLSRVAVIGGDNDQPELLLKALQGAHVLVHEATVTQEVLDKVGPVWMHSSAKMVAEVAEDSGVPNLILTHFSGRYRLSKKAGPASMDVMRDEARKFYHGTIALAEDLKTWELNREYSLKKL